MREHGLNLPQLLLAARRRFECTRAVAFAFGIRRACMHIRCIIRHQAMQQKNHFLGEVGDIAALLLYVFVERGVSVDDGGRCAHLDETFSPVIVIVKLVPETLKNGYEALAVVEVDGGGVGHGRVGSSWAVLRIIETTESKSMPRRVPTPRTIWRPCNAQEHK